MTQEIVRRRYDIDWLRVIAFGLLILYHIGMYYVADWEWHIKSDQQSEFLQNLMIMTNQWRMSLLFFLSGIALALIYQRYKATTLIGLRSQRLLVPLLFGMLVIVPPQLFYELIQGGYFDGNYLVFYREYLALETDLGKHKQSVIGLVTWNHLWFIPYLWCYSLIMVFLLPALHSLLNKTSVQSVSVLVAFCVITIGIALIWVAMRDNYPVTHALVDDWSSHAKYFTVFVAGCCLALLPDLWNRLIAKRRIFASLALLGYCWLMLDRHGLLDVGEALDQLLLIKLTHGLLLSTNHWAWILALVGYAGRYLQFSNRFLVYANQAILPWYILHQTLIIVIAMQLLPMSFNIWIEMPLLLLFTVGACFVMYELIKRFNILRLLFGLKRFSRD